MPEMNELMDDIVGKRNYIPPNSMGDSRLAQIGYKQQRGGVDDSDEDDIIAQKLDQVTPGRIRASKMGNSKRNNFIKSPDTTGTTLDFLNTTPLNQKPRATTRPKNPRVEMLDNTM